MGALWGWVFQNKSEIKNIELLPPTQMDGHAIGDDETGQKGKEMFITGFHLDWRKRKHLQPIFFRLKPGEWWLNEIIKSTGESTFGSQFSIRCYLVMITGCPGSAHSGNLDFNSVKFHNKYK